jgi:outer membrane lipoprotein-sorting protein
MNLRTCLLVGLLASAGQALAQGSLQASMAALDASSARFHSVQADFHKDLHEGPPINDTTTQDGRMYFMRIGGKPQMGIQIVGPGARTVLYKDGVLKDYNPGIRCFDTVSSGNQSKTESFLALGFGGSGKDLQASWNVADLGPDTISGVKVEKLDLVPKDPSVKSNVLHVALWVVLDRGYALKQVLYSPSGDTTTAVYSNVRYNDAKVETKPFEFNDAKPCSASSTGRSHE